MNIKTPFRMIKDRLSMLALEANSPVPLQEFEYITVQHEDVKVYFGTTLYCAQTFNSPHTTLSRFLREDGNLIVMILLPLEFDKTSVNLLFEKLLLNPKLHVILYKAESYFEYNPNREFSWLEGLYC